MRRNRFGRNIEPHVEKEIALAEHSRKLKNYRHEFHHLENAHVLGQSSTYWHTKVHLLMFMWALRNKKTNEVMGQVLRIIGAMTKTVIGLVPEGNTGGSNINPFRRLPIKPELQRKINSAKTGA